jgi:dephospho-CoA kinase
VAAVAAAFPGIVTAGAVDRTALGARVFDDPAALRRLEAILHPLVRKRETRFLLAAARRHCPLVVLDIPLLFETGGETRCDAVVVVTAPAFVQRRRVLSRPGVTPARFEAILRRQVPDCEKRRRADFIVPTGLGVAFSLRAVRKIVTVAQTIRARRWPG